MGWRQDSSSLLPASVPDDRRLVVPRSAHDLPSSLLDNNSKKFLGLDNYHEIFTTAGTRLTVINSLTWVLVGTTVTVIVGLAVARFADGMRGEKAAKSAIFIPGAVSLVGAGVIWRFVYDGPPFKVGLLNQVTKALHSARQHGRRQDPQLVD